MSQLIRLKADQFVLCDDRFTLVPTRANGQPAFACYLRDVHTPIAHA